MSVPMRLPTCHHRTSVLANTHENASPNDIQSMFEILTDPAMFEQDPINVFEHDLVSMLIYGHRGIAHAPVCTMWRIPDLSSSIGLVARGKMNVVGDD